MRAKIQRIQIKTQIRFGACLHTTVIQYKYRWNIEVLFKRLKQNVELGYFYSDSPEGIKTKYEWL